MQSKKILFVDDDPNLLAGFQRNLKKDYTFDTATGGADALKLIESSGPYAVIVADMQMPGMNGVELLSKAYEVAPDTVRVMLTGNADQKTAIDAVNQGRIASFLNKPCEPDTLRLTLDSSLKQYALIAVEKELLEGTLAGSVKVLSEVLSMIDPTSFGRGQKLANSIRTFGSFLGLKPTWPYEVAAQLSHIGFVSIPPIILRKMDQGMGFTTNEHDIVERSPQIGHDLLVNIPRMEPVAKIVLYQAKNFDGSGFPADRTVGEAIPIGARMLKILHDRAVMETDGIVKNRAYEAMKTRAFQYDPILLDKCFQCFESFLETPISADQPVQSVAVHELKAGQILVSDVKTKNDILLIAAGNHLTEVMIQRLHNYVKSEGVKWPIYVQ